MFFTFEFPMYCYSKNVPKYYHWTTLHLCVNYDCDIESKKGKNRKNALRLLRIDTRGPWREWEKCVVYRISELPNAKRFKTFTDTQAPVLFETDKQWDHYRIFFPKFRIKNKVILCYLYLVRTVYRMYTDYGLYSF